MGSSARKFLRQHSDSSAPELEILIRAFRKYFRLRYSWVLFKYGTAVIIGSVAQDAGGAELSGEQMEKEAKRFLKEHARIATGTPLADFNAQYDADLGGWMVTFQNDRIFTFIPGERQNSVDSTTTAATTPAAAVNSGDESSRTRTAMTPSSDAEVTTSSGSVSFSSANLSNDHSQSQTFGLLGRILRQKDAKDLNTIYVFKPDPVA